MTIRKLKHSLLCVVMSCILFAPSKIGAGEAVEYTEIKNETLQNELKEIEEISRISYKISLIRRDIDFKTAHTIAESIYEHSKDKMDPSLILAIMSVESWFRIKAKSPAGARGLMQVMPLWKPECGDDLYDIDTNIQCGIMIYTKYEKMFKRIDMTLTAYNRGPKAVKRDLCNGIDPRTDYAWRIIRMYKKLKRADFDTPSIYLASL
jgi:soluble lytic murein transglycosylase-like protein